MNTKFIFILTLLALALPLRVGFAVEEFGLYNNGEKTFVCTRGGKVGRSRVQSLGGGRYRVFGPHFKGEVTAASFAEAAKRSCGEPVQ